MEKLIIGVSGINAVDNPGPGIGVIRSLKEDKSLNTEIIGLAYDASEPGIYMEWLVDSSFILPYPSGSNKDYISRLLYIREKTGMSVIVPTLDAELPLFIQSSRLLNSYGIKTFLPTKDQFDIRSKTSLTKIAEKIGMKTPKTKSITSYHELLEAVNEIGLPVMVKGVFYKAYRAYTYQEATEYFNRIVAQWGYPVIIQQVISGDEMNVVGVGDGTGGILGLVAIKKLWVTSLGKIWTAVTIKNKNLTDAGTKFCKELKWRGAFEIECIVSEDNIYLIEINPRFPAWVYFATGVGINLPSILIKTSLGIPVKSSLDNYEAGKMYVRYTYDIVTDMSIFQNLVLKGES